MNKVLISLLVISTLAFLAVDAKPNPGKAKLLKKLAQDLEKLIDDAVKHRKIIAGDVIKIITEAQGDDAVTPADVKLVVDAFKPCHDTKCALAAFDRKDVRAVLEKVAKKLAELAAKFLV